MTWTNIPDNNLLPGKPGRSIDMLAIRDNIINNRFALITTSGTFTPLPGITDYLVIVGGAGGGSGYSTTYGGNWGGAGGNGVAAVISVSGVTTPQTITLGAGGTAGVYPSTNGTAGGTTTAFGVSISGGGAGVNGALSSSATCARGVATGGKTIIASATPGGLAVSGAAGAAQNGQSGWVLVLW